MWMNALFLLTSCSSNPTIKATVVDIWDKPVPSATIVQEGVVERITVDGQGLAEIEVEAGTIRLMAGAEHFIKDLVTVVVEEDGEEPNTARFTLFPEPAEPGFYAVGPKAYVPIASVPIKRVESDKNNFIGIEEIPKARIGKTGGQPHRIVFRTSLRTEELSRFDLTLSRLEYIKKAPAKTLLGDVDVRLELWAPKKDVPFNEKRMQNKENYLLLTKGELAPGVYAFHAQGVMDATSNRPLDRLPEELRVVYPFEVR